jgi:hypothetical protein
MKQHNPHSPSHERQDEAAIDAGKPARVSGALLGAASGLLLGLLVTPLLMLAGTAATTIALVMTGAAAAGMAYGAYAPESLGNALQNSAEQGRKLGASAVQFVGKKIEQAKEKAAERKIAVQERIEQQREHLAAAIAPEPSPAELKAPAAHAAEPEKSIATAVFKDGQAQRSGTYFTDQLAAERKAILLGYNPDQSRMH